MSQKTIKRRASKYRVRPAGIMLTARCSYEDCEHDRTYFRVVAGQACPYCRRPLSWRGVVKAETNKYAVPEGSR
jgi:hypothetical protein